MTIGGDWKDAASLEGTVIKFFEERRTDSNEFKELINYYGREKLAKIYETWKTNNPAQQGGDSVSKRILP
jgi:hypothetical protein